MGRNEVCLEKCKKKHLGKIVKSTDSQWEEPSSNMKPKDNANKPN